MRRNILWQRIVNLLNIARYIQISAIVFKNIRILHKPRIARYLFPCRECPHDLLNILFPQPILISVLFEATAGINDKYALTLICIFFVNDHDAGRNASAIEQVCREAHNALDISLVKDCFADILFRISSEQYPMGHNNSRFSLRVKRFQHMKKPCIVTILLRWRTITVKSLIFIIIQLNAVAPRFIRKRWIHNDKIILSKPKFCCKCRIYQRIALSDLSRAFLVQDQVHPGKTGCRRIFLLSEYGYNGITARIHRCLISSSDQKAAAACCRIQQCHAFLQIQLL